jgi:hypothetical protein
MYPEVSSKVCHDSFCHLENSVSPTGRRNHGRPLKRIIVNDKLVRKERSSYGLESLEICMDVLLATIRHPAEYSIYGLKFYPATSGMKA